jgi:hypothetical protein
MGNMPAGQNHSNFALNTRLSAPRYDTWCKIQVICPHCGILQRMSQGGIPQGKFFDLEYFLIYL